MTDMAFTLLDSELPEQFAGDENRGRHWQRWLERGLPTRKVERWKYTPVHYLKEAVLTLPRAEQSKRLDWQSPEPEYYRMVLVDGVFSEAHSNLPSGVRLDVKPGQGDCLAEDFAMAELNAALSFTGYDIQVESNLDKPLVITKIFQEAKLSAHYRNTIRLEANIEATVIDITECLSTEDVFTTSNTAITLSRDARLKFYRYVPKQPRLCSVEMMRVTQDKNSHLDALTVDFGAKLSRQELDVELVGEGASCDLSGLYYATGDTQVDNYLTVRHRASHTRSNQTFKGVADDEATTVFSGVVDVEQGLKGIAAHQYNPNILLSEKATMNTKPELLIYSDDIQCSHGATVGALDPEALFYLKSRGIKHAEAHAMLIDAFLSELIVSLPEDAYRKAISETLYQESHRHA